LKIKTNPKSPWILHQL